MTHSLETSGLGDVNSGEMIGEEEYNISVTHAFIWLQWGYCYDNIIYGRKVLYRYYVLLYLLKDNLLFRLTLLLQPNGQP